jgi:hypothetical protein
MINRIPNLSLITFVCGLLILSLGYNCFLSYRLNTLCEAIEQANYWVSPNEYNQIQKELDRLEKASYTK